MAVARKYTKELLEPLVARSTSVAGVMRLLDLRANGGAHPHVSRTIQKLGIDTSHFRRDSPGARWLRLTPEQILVRRAGNGPRQKPALLKRALCESGVEYVCSMCNNDGTWMGETLTLEIDHIDGDFQNNQIANLRFLCPNCHRLTPNFAGRGRGRFTRDLTTTASASDD